MINTFKRFVRRHAFAAQRRRHAQRSSRIENLEARALLSAVAVFDTPGGTTTSESGSITTVRVKLASDPGIITYNLDVVHDATEVSVSKNKLTFDNTNWDTYQEIAVTGEADGIADGDIWWSLRLVDNEAPMPELAGSLDMLNEDVDSVVKIKPLGPSEGFLAAYPEMGQGRWTSENGVYSHAFTIELQDFVPPGVTVDIPLSIDDPTEGSFALGAASSSKTVTLSSTTKSKTVTVYGVDDPFIDGDQIFKVVTGASVSTNAAFDGFNAPDVTIVNIDNERGLGSPGGQQIAEWGSTDDVFLSLSSRPASDVTITASVTDSTEGMILSSSSVTFTSENWETMQSITVQGVDDPDIDGDVAFDVQFAVTASSSDPLFGGMTIDNIAMTNEDDDMLFVDVTGTDANEGDAIVFTVSVTAPAGWSGSVTLTFYTSDGMATEGADYIGYPGGLTLTFNASSLTQTVSVSTIDDSEAEGDEDLSAWVDWQSGDPLMMGSSGTAMIWDNDEWFYV